MVQENVGETAMILQTLVGLATIFLLLLVIRGFIWALDRHTEFIFLVVGTIILLLFSNFVGRLVYWVIEGNK